MKYPVLTIETRKIKHNARVISSMLKDMGIDLLGVSKAVLSHPAVVSALIQGGAYGIGDSRVQNLRELRKSGFSGRAVLLRSPGPSLCKEAVLWADASLNSNPRIVSLLGEAALAAGKIHEVVLMIELGDLREGVMVEDAVSVAREFVRTRGVRLIGIGANLACFGGVVPTREKMELLLEVADRIRKALGITLAVISGGNSANMRLMLDKDMPEGITELRIGEAVLLGRETVNRSPVPGCYLDAFTLKAEVIEILRKPTKPWGEISQDAFGEVPTFEDRGVRWRAILAAGRQDIDPTGLYPRSHGVRILGASSDHLVCDVEDYQGNITTGTIFEFDLNYSALLRAATSPHVEKVVS